MTPWLGLDRRAPFGARALYGEHPLDASSGFVALFLPSGNLRDQLLALADPPVETLPTQDADLNLDHIEPARVLGRVMEFQATKDTMGFWRRKGFIESSGSVSG